MNEPRLATLGPLPEAYERLRIKHRRMVLDALVWLEDNEPSWGLSEPINREEFIIDLLDKAERPNKK